jgi:transcriptional regulator with XRE-family HTH domain
MDDMDSLKRHLGAALLTARERAGLTQAEVSSRVGLASAIYGRIERGQMLPSVPTLHRLCSTLHLSATSLLALDEPGFEPPAPAAESPELEQLALLVRLLSPSELRCLGALALDISRRGRRGAPPED